MWNSGNEGMAKVGKYKKCGLCILAIHSLEMCPTYIRMKAAIVIARQEQMIQTLEDMLNVAQSKWREAIEFAESKQEIIEDLQKFIHKHMQNN